MKYWNNIKFKLTKIEKILIFLFISIQMFIGYYYFFTDTQNLTWRELIFSVLIVIPWILSIVMYLNFRLISFSNTFINIRQSTNKRIVNNFKMIFINIILCSLFIFLIANIYIINHNHDILSIFLVILEITVRYMIFLLKISLIQVIFMKIINNRGLVTVFIYIIFFVGMFTRQNNIALILFSPLYPSTLIVSDILISIGLVFIFSLIYMYVEEQKEFL